MSVLSRPITGHTEVYVSGEVTIDETAAIASGVILQATAQGRIVIKAGACIGMGTILTANEGTIEIGEGVILGAGVLIVGSGKISDRACIGAASTLISTSVEEMQLVSPGSLLGAPTRAEKVSNSQNGQSNHFTPENNGSATTSESNNSSEVSSASNSNHQTQDNSEDPWNQDQNTAADEENNTEQSRNQATIYGQTHIERLMVTLFPHKDQFNKPNNNS